MANPSSLRLDDTLRKELQRVAKADHVSVSDITREALRRYLAARRFERMSEKFTRAAAAKGLVTEDDFDRAVVAGKKNR